MTLSQRIGLIVIAGVVVGVGTYALVSLFVSHDARRYKQSIGIVTTACGARRAAVFAKIEKGMAGSSALNDAYDWAERCQVGPPR